MNIAPIKTHKITDEDKDILSVIDKYVLNIEEHSILVITSKIVSICEGNTIPLTKANKDELVISEADQYLPKESNSFNLFVTIKNNILAVNAGIDESNSQNEYVLWPKNPQESANLIWKHLKEKFDLGNVGVLITDSKTTPLRYGITGIGIACCGFAAINDFVGTPDIFGRILKMTKVNVMDGLAAASAVVMGEGSEQTPLSIISDIPFVQFQNHTPTDVELKLLDIDPATDVYGAILQNTPWQKGEKS
ncbi:MAG: coenzyme F420-0:L-glutamate ligase [Candidatus Levybacteria bacterium]|nr:coenzyme F420-0:L-glutamate ligase [Candidatus Levybacteria bacterium]